MGTGTIAARTGIVPSRPARIDAACALSPHATTLAGELCESQGIRHGRTTLFAYQ